ncbi:MAG TPA: hypothetical protein VH637_18540 [Streptosporangiaceae bacterium]|jgi:hypothetical protein
MALPFTGQRHQVNIHLAEAGALVIVLAYLVTAVPAAPRLIYEHLAPVPTIRQRDFSQDLRCLTARASCDPNRQDHRGALGYEQTDPP